MRAVLVAAGDAGADDVRWLEGADLVVAVDGGAAWLAGLGRTPDALVGDLDSVEPELLRRLQAAGVTIERHPSAKDSSDAELAVAHARGRGADEVLVIGAFGGTRIDHEIANLLMLSADTGNAYGSLRLVRGATRVGCLHAGQRADLEAAPGCLVSLFPVGGPARGVTTIGLRYPLRDEALPVGSTRGLSNVVDESPAAVELLEGAVLVVEQLEGDESR